MNDVSNSKRPFSITIICIFELIIFSVGIYIFSLPSVKELFASEEIFLNLINLWVIARLIINIGLWRMKKWAAYMYILVETERLVTNELSFRSLVITALSVYFVSKNIFKMS